VRNEVKIVSQICGAGVSMTSWYPYELSYIPEVKCNQFRATDTGTVVP